MYDHVLVALDGSPASRYAGEAALALVGATGGRVTGCHVYGVEIHQQRFSDMEPGLPAEYQEEEKLADLRTAHDRLMREGFQALSAGYVEDFAASACKAGVEVESVAMSGRSYTGILHLAHERRCDLIALGADGLGAIGNGMLGGTTTRILHSAPCDILIARQAPSGGAILTGVDGSDEALEAVGKAVSLGRAMNRPVKMVAAYDPDFHTHVFGVMGESLSPERQEEVGLAGQERLHDDIINDGLGKLYADFLCEAERRFSGEKIALETSLVTGKAYSALDLQATEAGADLIVVGRHGHHREFYSELGSNAEGLLRITSSNVLLVGGVKHRPRDSKAAIRIEECKTPAAGLAWDSDAESRLQRVPSFARGMAKRAVENAVRELGKSRVSGDDFAGVAAKFGMGSGEGEA